MYVIKATLGSKFQYISDDGGHIEDIELATKFRTVGEVRTRIRLYLKIHPATKWVFTRVLYINMPKQVEHLCTL